MIKVLFICHGNICRSTMAEFVMKDLIRKRGLQNQFYIDSKATSTEEIGNGPHYGTVSKLREVGVPIERHRASQMTKKDYDEFDYIVGMDKYNYRNIIRIVGGDKEGKVSLLLEHAGLTRDIADPWYTGNFDQTYEDVLLGCEKFLLELIEKRE